MNKVIAVFDVGKTNKKCLLFNKNLEVVYQHEESFAATVDEDGFECDSVELITGWIKNSLRVIMQGVDYDIVAVNFTTYGASLAFVDAGGRLLTPIYNYLKEVDIGIQDNLFISYGGEAEFCRKTASPKLGLLLNSGIQILWLKKEKPLLFGKVAAVMHFPQYLSYIFTQQVVSEPTSIGCHTFLWDFDKNGYHAWLGDNGIELPQPKPNTHKTGISIGGKPMVAGIGIHDSSASLVPYLKGSSGKFILVSTGTWCINMNPFNHTPLTPHQLKNDCLCFLSIDRKQVKSSRFFMGHIHDVNTRLMARFFKVAADSYKKVKTDEVLICNYLKNGGQRLFFKNDMPGNYVDESVDLRQFDNFSEAYHRLMYDISLLNAESIELILPGSSGVKTLYVSGGFARNEIFVRLMASFYPDMEVLTSDVDNSSAMGAALVVWDAMAGNGLPNINLRVKVWSPFPK